MTTTEFRTWNWDPASDRDFIGLPVTTVSAAPSKQRQWTQEVRYAGSLTRQASFVAGVFAFTLLMITREGMETAMLVNALLFNARAIDIAGGAIGGTIVAAVIAWLWSRYGYRVNLARFFQVTAIFLLVFVVQLLIYGFHELTEANVFPGSERLHWATEPYGPDGVYGHYLSYMLVALPLAWLALSSLFGQSQYGRPRRCAASGADPGHGLGSREKPRRSRQGGTASCRYLVSAHIREIPNGSVGSIVGLSGPDNAQSSPVRDEPREGHHGP